MLLSPEVGPIEMLLSPEVENVCAGPFPPKLQLMRWIGRQTWVPKGIDRILRTIQGPGDAYGFEVDFFGQRYRGNLRQYIDWMVFCYGSYVYCELSLMEEVASLLRHEKGFLTYFDVGANLGHHVLFMAGKADRIIAFEPNPESLKSICDKVSLNHLANVDLVPVGLGAEDANLSYFAGGESNSGSGTFCPEGDPADDAKKTTLSVRQGDRLCDDLHLPPIDLLKIDVEGFESYVLQGLLEHVLRDRPVILMELSDRSRAAFGGEQALRELLYSSAAIAEVKGRSGCRYKLRPFHFEASHEILIVPPEMRTFVQDKMPGTHLH